MRYDPSRNFPEQFPRTSNAIAVLAGLIILALAVLLLF